ncbi:hypothetical protein KDW10_25015 [Burkholderia vietnamiensis]|uniref:hypothetical protein n=1 Tax=Burkholderia vietnamiensis TaxID=60552 RepID=UPI001BA423DB|nr:hypothetical protein [Burkholderia vietnamiensis]MBR8360589.1 hypothetical protein [Burkholderia vietnamiensis]
MKVTFDTNTLDKAVRPERFTKDPDRSHFDTVHQALAAGTVQGFVCETIVTLEGIQKDDRSSVFGSTRLDSSSTEEIDDQGNLTIKMDLKSVQPDRKPLHRENAARMQATVGLGLRLIKAPRIGGTNIEDPEGTIYVQQTPQQMTDRHELFCQVIRAIEQRGVGIAVAKSLGQKLSQRAGAAEPWFKGLGRASDVHEERQVARAIAEWADGDNLGAHIAYANDLFCTGDLGKSAGNSILDASNRTWLEQTYGVRFVTLPELASMLGDSSSA